MADLNARIAIRQEAKKRVSKLEFGDAITNICAGRDNPHRHSYFVQRKKDSVKCTDKKGRFWETAIDVIYSGHLEYGTCEALFEPVWQANYG